MKNVTVLMTTAVLALSVIMLGQTATADTELTTCSMDFNVQFGSFIIGGGGGTGVLNCVGADGLTLPPTPVHINILSFGLQAGGFNVVGHTGSLGVHDPTDLFGQYGVIGLQVGAIIAAGTSFGLEHKETGGNANVTVDGGFGLGASLALTSWDIQPAYPDRFPRYRHN